MHTICTWASEATDGPFPWNEASGSFTCVSGALSTVSSRPKLVQELPARQSKPRCEYLLDNPRVREQTELLISESRARELPLAFRLPRKGLVAGSVLQHALCVVQEYFTKLEPLVFKFGWTHNPIWRWSDDMYGYTQDVDIWSEMVILHVSHEAYGPAMLEAALISMYQSNSLAELQRQSTIYSPGTRERERESE